MQPYYERDGITIYHGRCEPILASLDPDAVDLVLTDPPYGIALHTSGGPSTQPLAHTGPSQMRRRRANRPIIGDDGPVDLAHVLRFRRLIIFGAQHFIAQLPPSRSWFVWDKREGRGSDFVGDCEMAWTNVGNRNRLYSQMWRGMICRGEENGKPRLHPTQKPIGLMTWCLEQARLAPRSMVVDPYMGSGSSIIAAYRHGHRAIGIEIDETYIEATIRRLECESTSLRLV